MRDVGLRRRVKGKRLGCAYVTFDEQYAKTQACGRYNTHIESLN